jgi:predicted SAM-dependent methyltransferase
VRLNLGCGKDIKDGWVNVDIYGEGVFRHDLNQRPWPWANDSVDEIAMHHVLEHLPDTIGVMKELYRVCRDGAIVHIAVPHPFHEDFVSDPTHVSPITIRTMQAFSKKVNQQYIKDANNPLGLIHNVDFEMVRDAYVVEQKWMKRVEDGLMSEEQLRDAITTFNGVVKQIEMDLKVIK